MSVAAKKVRRRLLLAGVCLGILVMIGGLFYARRLYVRRQDRHLRADGIAAVQAGRYEEALQKLEPYLKRHRDDAHALAAYINARPRVEAPRNGHILATMDGLRQLLALEPGRVTDRKVLMSLYLQSGMLAEAIDSADRLLAAVPGDPEALRAKTYASMQPGRYSQAKANCEAWCKAAPLDLEAHLTHIGLQRELGESDESVVGYARSVRAAHPGNGRFDLVLACAYNLVRDPVAAIPYLRLALVDAIIDPIVVALPWLQRPGRVAPTDSAFLAVLSSQLESVRRYNESLAMLLRVGAVSGSNARLERTIIIRLWEAERYQEAIDHMVTSTSTSLLEPEMMGLRAVALVELGRRPEAVALREKLLARENDIPAAAWAAILQTVLDPETADYKRVVEATRPLLDGRSASPYVRFYTGEAFARLGESDLAFSNWLAAQQGSTWARPALRVSSAALSIGDGVLAASMAMAACLRTHDSRPAALALANALGALVESADQPQVADVAYRLLTDAQRNWPEDDNTLPIVLLRPLDLSGTSASRRAFPSALEDSLFRLLDAIARRWPDEDSTLPMAASLRLRRSEPQLAAAVMQRALNAPVAPSSTVLLRLADLSLNAHLGLEDALLARSEKAHGLTADLVTARALGLWREGKGDAGLKLIEQSIAGKDRSSAIPYRLAWARYLTLRRDKRAPAAWIGLADDLADNATVQRMALDAAPAQGDREFQLRAIDRLHALTGEQALAWRVHRARWLMAGSPREKDLSEAASLLTEVVQRVPQHATARLMLANCMERQNNFKGAITHLDAVVRTMPASLDVTLNLAQLLVSQNEMDRARELLQGISQRYLAESNRRRDAVVAAGRRVARAPLDFAQYEPAAEDLFHQAYVEFSSGRSVKQLAIMLGEQNQSEQALALLERALDMGRDDAASLVLANLYRQRKMPGKAEAIYKKLMADPSPMIIRATVEFYLTQQNFEEAQRILGLLPGLKPEPGIEQSIRASFESRPEVALTLLQAAVDEAPKNPGYWRQLVLWYVREGRPNDALATAAKAHDALAPEKAFAAFLQQADKVSALTEPPDRPIIAGLLDERTDQAATVEALIILADVRRNKLAPDQYLPRLRRVAEKYPHYIALHTLLAGLYANIGRPDDAIAIATRCMEAVPTAVEPAEMAAMILAREGRWTEVAPVATAWRDRLVGDTLRADMLLASAYVQTGRASEAVRQLQPYAARALSRPDRLGSILTLYLGAMLAAGQDAQAATFLGSSPATNEQVRNIVMSAVSEHASTPDSAATWLNRLAATIPTDNALRNAADNEALAEAWFACGARLKDPRTTQNARKQLDELAARPDLMPDVAVKVAMLYERLGARSTAEPIYRQVIAISAVPYIAGVARNNLSMLLADRGKAGDLDEALKLAQKAAETVGGDQKPVATFYDSLAFVRQRRGEYAEAATAAEKAISLAPQDLSQRLRLASIYLDASQFPQAKATLADIEQRMANTTQQVPRAQQDQFATLKSRLPTSRPATKP